MVAGGGRHTDSSLASTMATCDFPAPKHFDVSQPQSWPAWLEHCERFLSALDTPESSRPHRFLLLAGPQIAALVKSLDTPVIKRGDYDAMKKKLTEHFHDQKPINILHERFIFNRRVQGEKEGVDEYISDLCTLSERCGYGDQRDEHIRDRLLAGLKDTDLAEELVKLEGLTLARAIMEAKLAEQAQKLQDLEQERFDAVTKLSHRAKELETLVSEKTVLESRIRELEGQKGVEPKPIKDLLKQALERETTLETRSLPGEAEGQISGPSSPTACLLDQKQDFPSEEGSFKKKKKKWRPLHSLHWPL